MANTDFVLGANIDFQGVYQALGMLLERRTTDPAVPAQSQVWVRTDTTPAKIKWYDGSTVQTLADLNSVLLSVAAADGTVTVATNNGAVTIKVAKTLDSTYITNFDAAVRSSRLDQMAAPGGDVSWNNYKLTNLADAVNAQDAVNLRTVQALLSGLSDRAEVYYAATTPLPANTYSNGAAGVGATLTASANGALSVDGAAVQAGDRLLVTGEVATANNGLYVVTATGGAGAPYVLTRATDFDQNSEIGTGILVPVKAPANRTAGTSNDQRVFLSVAPTPFTLGTSALTFSTVGNTYTAGTGLTLTGTTFSLSTPVGTALGGTGATTVSGARQNLAVPAEVYQTVGDGVSTNFTFDHNLNNSKVAVTVTRVADGATINCGVRRTTANRVIVYVGTSAAPIGSNTHVVTVSGREGVG